MNTASRRAPQQPTERRIIASLQNICHYPASCGAVKDGSAIVPAVATCHHQHGSHDEAVSCAAAEIADRLLTEYEGS